MSDFLPYKTRRRRETRKGHALTTPPLVGRGWLTKNEGRSRLIIITFLSIDGGDCTSEMIQRSHPEKKNDISKEGRHQFSKTPCKGGNERKRGGGVYFCYACDAMAVRGRVLSSGRRGDELVICLLRGGGGGGGW